ncbi:MAG: ABC transporter ATP-binding protein [Anaerolineae bacterium]
MAEPLLQVCDLAVAYATPRGNAWAVRQASLSLARGEVLGLVGESGCGKSTLGLSLLGLLSWPGRVCGGRILFEGRDLLALDQRELRRLRGERLAMVFQNPMSSLNPTEPIGDQIAEMITAHRPLSRGQLRARCIELLELVGIPAAEKRLRDYPHEFSGGMRQRVLIAIALALDPDLLVADEPTTALDLTVQGQILWLLEDIQRRSGMAMIYITHNLAVAASISDRIAVMYAGLIVEIARAEELFRAALHPYSRALVSSVPQSHWQKQRVEAIPGQPPDPREQKPGCPFAPRCPRQTAACWQSMPLPVVVRDSHMVRCFHADG